jgi:hypothetical protein
MQTKQILSVGQRFDTNKMPVINCQQNIDNLTVNTLCVPLDLYLKAVKALEICEAKLIDVCLHGQDADLRKFCGLSGEVSLFRPLSQ